MANDRPKLQLSAPQVIGGALAAASAAVASSWLGVAGTVLGAVIVSLVASIGSAVYTHSLERSSRKIRETLPVVPLRSTTAFTTAPRHDATTPMPSVSPPADEGASGSDPTSLKSPTSDGASIPWRTVAVSAVASLVIAAAALTGLEMFAGKPLSALTGANDDRGTTMSQLVGDDPAASTPPAPEDGATDPSTSTDRPSSGEQTSPTEGAAPQGVTPGTQGPADGSAGTPTDGSGTPTDGSGTPTDGSATSTEPTPTEPTPTTPTEPTPTDATPTS